MLYFSRWSSPLMSSQLWSLCPFVAHFGYLLTRGRIFSMAAHSAYTLQALVGMVSAPTAESLSALAGGVIASDRTPHLCGWLLAPVSPIKAAREIGSLEISVDVVFSAPVHGARNAGKRVLRARSGDYRQCSVCIEFQCCHDRSSLTLSVNVLESVEFGG